MILPVIAIQTLVLDFGQWWEGRPIPTIWQLMKLEFMGIQPMLLQRLLRSTMFLLPMRESMILLLLLSLRAQTLMARQT